MRSLQAFSTTGRLHKVALELLAFAAPSHEVDQLRNVFVAIDADGSGELSYDEFGTLLRRHGIRLEENDMQSLMEGVDASGDGP